MSISSSSRRRRGAQAYRRGLDAEKHALSSLMAKGYHLLSHRLKTPFGEIDLVVARENWVVAIEVKYRPSQLDGAYALSHRQKKRLLEAFSFILETRTDWHYTNTRFDVILVDAASHTQQIKDALRLM